MTAWESLSDAQLIARMSTVADACVRIVDMPEEQRRAAGPKGEASPEQAGAMSAALVMQMVAECKRRGIYQA